MKRAVVLLFALTALVVLPGCAGVGLASRLQWDTKHPYRATLVAYHPGSDGPGEAEFLLVANDDSGLTRRHTLVCEWWPLPSVSVSDPFPPPAVRTREVVDYQLHGGCVPNLGQIGIDSSPETHVEVEVRDGVAWRTMGALPSMTEPPHPICKALSWVLIPVAFAVDALTFPLQIGGFLLAIWIFD